MSRLLRQYLLSITIILLTASRLPAPILDESPTPAPEEAAATKPKHSKKVKNDDSAKPKSEATPRMSGVARNLDGPKPIFPPEAAALHLTGTGRYLLQFDQNTGRVIDVTVAQSAGSPILDNAAMVAFRQWHEDPRCAKEVTMTMTFAPTQNAQE